MKVQRKLVVAALAAALSSLSPGTSVHAAGSETPNEKYIEGKGARFESLAGSHRNLERLVSGLRTSREVTLVERTPNGPRFTRFDPPTRPMGYGNITRSLDLADRQLASHGITDPTAAQLKAALNGGTVTTAKGDVRLDGVLRLRSEGMGWGKIAHTIGVHPGHGSHHAHHGHHGQHGHHAQHGHHKHHAHHGHRPPHAQHAHAKPHTIQKHPSGHTAPSHAAPAATRPVPRVTTAAGTGHSNVTARPAPSGIVTAAGASPPVGGGRGAGNAPGTAGAPPAGRIHSAMGPGSGNGNAFGKTGK